MFEKASKMKLRFQTPKGQVGTEDLWDLSLQNLNTMAKDFSKKIKENSEPDFLGETTTEDTMLKLGFDIVVHVIEVKKVEAKSRLDEVSKKVERQKIMEVLSRKQAGQLENLSVEELNQKLAELG